MKIVIFGATEIGCLLATEFFEDHDITVIDKEENRTEEFDKRDISFVHGNATDVKVLKSADIVNADVFIACTAMDEANIVACLTVKKLSGIRTICFVSKEEYLAANEAYLNVPIDSPEEFVLMTEEELAAYKENEQGQSINPVKTDKPVKGVFSITGLKVADKVDKSLPKGIYIVNGKKIIIK